MPETADTAIHENKYPAPQGHSLALKDRRQLAVTGVGRIVSCDETAAVLETALGTLTVGGQVQISGTIEFLQYAENRQSSGGLLARLFR